MESDIRKYIEAKKLMGSLEEKIAKYRSRIMEDLKSKGTTRMTTPDYRVSLRVMKSEHVYKRDVPPDIWDRYKRGSEVEQLVITSAKDKKKKE